MFDDPSFVHLHVHTEFSQLDGTAKMKPLVQEAAKLGMPAVGMTDHGSMFGAHALWKASKALKAGAIDVKPILGIEAYIAPGSRFTKHPVYWADPAPLRAEPADTLAVHGATDNGAFTHMTMLAVNSQGLRNLFALSSLASSEGHYLVPRMDRDLIAQHSTGIVATTGCPDGEIQTRLRLGQFDEAVAAAAAYREIFGEEHYFLELMDHKQAIERQVRDDLLRIGRRLGIPPLATNDAHYLTQDDAAVHDALLAVGAGTTLDDSQRFRFNSTGFYLKSARQMRDLFDNVPGACDNTLLISDMVAPDAYDEVFGNDTNRLPQPPAPDGRTQASWLRDEAFQGVERRFAGTRPPAVVDRVEAELALIDQAGDSSYFRLVADICRHARANGILVGPGRGTVPGSMVAYTLGITELDPIEHGLVFERFLNPERIAPTDIDLDVDERRRGEVMQYVADTYGLDAVALTNKLTRFTAVQAIDDAARILGYPSELSDMISGELPLAMPLHGVFDPKYSQYRSAAVVRALYDSDRDAQRIIDTARGFEGLLRDVGTHYSAMVVSGRPLTDAMQTHVREDGALVAGLEYQACEALGMLPMDILGLRELTIVTDTLTAVRANHGVAIDLDTLDLDDAQTFGLLSRGGSIGVFQLDTPGARDLLQRTAPTEFGDVTALLALYRPGPMNDGTHIDYADRKNGLQEPAPIHPELAEALEPILGETYGLVVYQEQIIKIAHILAGYTLGGADLLRRELAKKNKVGTDAEFANFSAGMAANGYSPGAARAVWDVIGPVSRYAFPKAHTAGYGIISFWMAYLKAHYPAELMAALVASAPDEATSAMYLAESRRVGVALAAA